MGLVLCVLVLGMLAPAVSRALAWARSTTAVEICSATGGAQWVRLPASAGAQGTDTAPAPQPSVDHCPFCLQATDRGAAPPPALPSLFRVVGADPEPPRGQVFAFSSSHLWAASARGPPAQG